uniref:Protein BANP n=1 Tax=Fundulus heteroclitus TaxID=8078 RepID=A0A3Q2T2E5_FUNHE
TMSGQELDEIVQITVEEFHQDDRTGKVTVCRHFTSGTIGLMIFLNDFYHFYSQNLLVSFTDSISQRLEGIESKLQSLDATCKVLVRKLDSMAPCAKSPVQVPMVAGSPQGATQTWNKVRCTVARRRQNTILVKVPGAEESQEEQESGSEASDSVSNSGQSSGAPNGQNVTLITLNAEEDYPEGTWLGDENNSEMRVRCPISPSDMLYISTNCRTAEKMALTLLDYLFHREVQAMSNLSGQGKHGKKQLDPLMIYGIRCHLFHKFGISESDWYRIKQSIDSKCRTAWRRKQRGQSLAVKSFSKRTPRSTVAEEGISDEAAQMEAATQQTLHYTLANQQVQFHRIGEDGQVQVGQLHIAQVPQGEEVQITQDSEGNLQIHQVHVGQDGQVLRGAQLIAVASADGGATAVEGSALPPDIQVQYVQLAPVSDHTAAVQTTTTAQPELQKNTLDRSMSLCFNGPVKIQT